MRRWLGALLAVVLGLIVAPALAHYPAETSGAEPTTATGTTVRFAVIGDYGMGNQAEHDVAQLVAGWQPNFVVTVGDNNYPAGSATTIDRNIGRDYHSFIAPYRGQYGGGANINRFFPTLGNHDWQLGNARPYLDFFTLPGNERYYDVVQGSVHLFAIDSDPHEPDGVTVRGRQAQWLRNRLMISRSCWDLVFMHHPPFSSGREHGSSRWMQWPYADWGADAVFAGHDHEYERILRDDMPYWVNGLGGASRYSFGPPIPGSAARFNADVGALLVVATSGQLMVQFITRTGKVIDSYTLRKRCG